MMLRLSPKRIALLTVLWEGVFILLVLTRWNYLQMLNIVGFLTLALLPGALTMMLLRLPRLPSWITMALVIGWSVLELMLTGLIINTALPHLGIARPLDTPYLLIAFVVLVHGLLTAIMTTQKGEVRVSLYPFLFFRTKRDTILALVPLLFVGVSIIGAIHLNDGGTGGITMSMLGLMAVYVAVLIGQSKRVGENVIPTAIFFMTLSLLFMTSLRGWFVTGHDIQQEYKVFQLTQSAGWWNITGLREAYNACLSITILPTMIGNILSVAPQYVFKIFFQMFFALTPVLVYFIAKRWTNKSVALVSTIYFIAFPTFFIDMPFLDRQEIAFLFYGLMLYSIFEDAIPLSIRRILFVVLGVGVVISHYSTTYTIIVVLGLVTVCTPLIRRLLTTVNGTKLFKHSAVATTASLRKPLNITPAMVVILLLVSFLWTSLITQTGSTVTSVIQKTWVSVRDGFGAGQRSGDATTLLTLNQLDPNALMQSYIKSTVVPLRAAGYQGEYYPESAYSQYETPGLPESRAPLTRAGAFLNGVFRADVPGALAFAGKLFAKLIELLIPLGIVYLIFRDNILERIDLEIFSFALFSLVFMALTVILPVLSIAYGILRAFQQSMFIIAPIMVVGSIVLWKAVRAPFEKRGMVVRTGMVFASGFVLVYFLYFTGFASQLLGDNIALLHLNNTGTYYDDFYVHAQELYGVQWLTSTSLNAQTIQFDVESDRFSSGKITSASHINPSNDIYPSIVRRDAYVYLSYANVTKARATELYMGNRITYRYPVQFLDTNKNLVYNNGGSRVYR